MAIQSFRCHDNFFHLCLDKGDIILEKYVDQLYGKVVPQNVRDFIDMMSDRKPARKQKITAPAETEKLSEQ